MKLWSDKKAESLKQQHRTIEKFWFHENVFKSTFFDASSVLIPHAESYIVRMMALVGSQITDPRVAKEKDLLVEEESAHVKVHTRYDQMLEDEGYKIESYKKLMLNLGRLFDKKFSIKSRLALCAATEHLTALMSLMTIDHGIMDDGLDERMRKVWLWHFLEEIDHRSASFDIYVHLGGGYFRRVWIMLWILPRYLWYNFRTRNGLLYQNGRLFDLGVHAAGWKFLWGKNGFHRNLLWPLAKYFSPSFHPSKVRYTKALEKMVHRYPIEQEIMTYFL